MCVETSANPSKAQALGGRHAGTVLCAELKELKATTSISACIQGKLTVVDCSTIVSTQGFRHARGLLLTMNQRFAHTIV